MLPAHNLALAVLTNAIDGPAHGWLDGVVHILRCFAKRGAPSRRLSGWTGRWWNLWGAVDLVPVGDRVLVASPAQGDPFAEASEIEVQGRNQGRIVLAGGFASQGEEVGCARNKSGVMTALKLAGGEYLPEAKAARELAARYERR